MKNIICEKCRKPVAISDRFCGHCGSKFLVDAVEKEFIADEATIVDELTQWFMDNSLPYMKRMKYFHIPDEAEFRKLAEILVEVIRATGLSLRVFESTFAQVVGEKNFYLATEYRRVGIFSDSLSGQPLEWFDHVLEIMRKLESIGWDVEAAISKFEAAREKKIKFEGQKSQFRKKESRASVKIPTISIRRGDNFFKASSFASLEKALIASDYGDLEEWAEYCSGPKTYEEVVSLAPDGWIVVSLWDEGKAGGGESLYAVDNGQVIPCFVAVEGGYGMNVPSFVEKNKIYSLSEFVSNLQDEVEMYRDDWS